MRTLVDIPDQDVQALDALRERRGASRARIIREAIREFLVKNSASVEDEAFGLWAGRGEDGLQYQRRIRAEW
ncbi:MAG: ribbon-helix-helix protein, CopG family [Caulobacterales bacterium]